jgi:ABC-2 type transport system permease protein
MSTALVIARAEARRIFLSPLAWSVLAVVQFIFGYIFNNLLFDYARNADLGDQYTGVADYMGGGLYGFAIIVLLLIMPLMTMRLFAEERKAGSLTLLLSSPATLTEIVLGKFLGVTAFSLALLALLAVMPLSLLPATALDLGRIGAGLLGLFLIMLSFSAAGLFASSLTREPTIAAVVAFGLLLMLWLTQILAYQEIPFAEVFNYVSLIGHFDSLRRGIFNTADVLYYVLLTSLFLWLTVQRLDLERN